jgi:hypothetical protein
MGCPYTWFRSFLSRSPQVRIEGAEARSLRVQVHKGGEMVVDVELPARSARWLMELIPGDVLSKIRAEQIPIDQMQLELEQRAKLYPEELFFLNETERQVHVWLE